jgi:cyanophycinase
LLDSIRQAGLIYLAGGDQSRFMDHVSGHPLDQALHEAYHQGSVIAGTSAGAAVMSRLMITGDQKKYPEYTGDFQTIEADNMELAHGMGFLSSVVIDQHFIKRMRFNRLLSVVLENPDITGIGIDESTALYVKGHHGKVYGEGQVLVIRALADPVQSEQGLLGARDIRLDLLLKGDTLTF